jgi:hypothetical protein
MHSVVYDSSGAELLRRGQHFDKLPFNSDLIESVSLPALGLPDEAIVNI